MKRLVIIFVLFLAATTASAQFLDDFSAGLESMITYYNDDEKVVNPGETDVRSNNYLRFNYFKRSFSASLQLESYIEEALLGYAPEFNKKLGVSMFSVAYTHNKLELSAGYLFDQFSSGLSFRTWEDRQLGLNNALVGVHLKYKVLKKVSIKGFLGKQKIGFDISKGTLMGLNTEIGLGKEFDIDLGIVSRYETYDSENPAFNDFTNLYSSKLIYSGKKFYGHVEYVYKSKDALVEFGNIIDSRLFSGNALSLNLGYFKSGFGFDATFRRLENMAFYTDRDTYGNIYNQLIVNYLPVLTKQHNAGLSNIYVYQAQTQLNFLTGGKAGEIGQQIDVFYKFSKKNSLAEKYKTVLAFNYASWFGLNSDFDLENRKYTSEFFKYGERYYRDINLELKNQWTDQWSTSLYWINQYYNMESLEAATGTVNTNIASADIYYTVNGKNEFRIQAEHLWTGDDKKNWIGGLIEYNFLRKFSIYATDQYNYGNDNSLEKIHYYNFGGTYRQGKTKISLNYGRQRGGLICVGGVCRFVPKSNGLSLAMNLYL